MSVRAPLIALCAGALLCLAGSQPALADNNKDKGRDHHEGSSKSLQARVARLEAAVRALRTENAAQAGLIAALDQRVAALEAGGGGGSQNPVFQVLALDAAGNLVVTGADLIVTGGNLHVRNGMGSTETINGKGNLIVGYDEAGGIVGAGGLGTPEEKTGSHYVVVGTFHSYTSHGGVVVGSDNAATAPSASVSGGWQNWANGVGASVSGGIANTASGERASVSGGQTNTASGNSASISGGAFNSAIGGFAWIGGGQQNTAGVVATSGSGATVSGGVMNTASGAFSSISGGQQNTTSGGISSISGGLQRTTSGVLDWAAGGLFQDF